VSYPERIVPEETAPGILAIHLRRYQFAEPWCTGRDVLDAACGVGYGSAHLASVAATVLGVDVSEEAIAYARRCYRSANVRFEVMDLTALDLPDASFGAACAFEAIEHVADPETAVGELARVLRPDGTLVLSTPNAPATTREPANPFHHVEYARDDLERLLCASFGEVDLYGQHRVRTLRHRVAQRLDVLGLRRRFPALARAGGAVVGTAPIAEVSADGIVIERGALDGAGELVAVCSAPRR
jgi:SAM-dependent methyltransferase